MNNAVGPLRTHTLAAVAIIGLAVSGFSIGLDIFAEKASAEGIRPIGNVCQWNRVGWNEMTLSERQAWMSLGWTLQRWESNNAPASSSKDWNELTPSEQYYAHQLGYGAHTWNLDCR
jgi:hypothetical protein